MIKWPIFGGWNGSQLALHRLIGRSRRRVRDEIRLRCHCSYLGDHQAVCRVLGRYSMFVDTTDIGFGTHVIMNGVWEMWLTEHVVRTIRPGWRVLDIGANFGYYSLLMADLVKNDGHCLAFEPNPHIARNLRRTLSVNGFDDRSEVREVALSATSGTSACFFIPSNEPKNSRIVPAISQDMVDRGLGCFIDVPTMSLDDLDLGQVNFIKIDAEGAEGAIIGGMMGLVRRDRPHMVIEYNCARLEDPRLPLEALLAVYGGISTLEMDGRVVETSIERILNDQKGEDWLLVLRGT